MDKLKQHRLKSIDELHMFSKTGVVMGSSTWSETYVSGGGGANNTNVAISSSVTERQRFFIREIDGDEVEVNNAGLGVRDGHVVTVVYCGKKNSVNDTGWPMGFANRHTRKTSYRQGSIDILTGKPEAGLLWLGLVPGTILLLIWLLGGQGWAFIPALLAFGLVAWWVVTNNKAKALSVQVRQAIDREVESTTDKVQALKAAQAPANGDLAEAEAVAALGDD